MQLTSAEVTAGLAKQNRATLPHLDALGKLQVGRRGRGAAMRRRPPWWLAGIVPAWRIEGRAVTGSI